MQHDHISQLELVQKADLANVIDKDASYGASWKQRGGIGAFMMAARKWDRLDNMMMVRGYDIFAAIKGDAGVRQGTDGTVLAEVRDLRRYLSLIEAQMVASGAVVIPEDLSDYEGAKPLGTVGKPQADVELKSAVAKAMSNPNLDLVDVRRMASELVDKEEPSTTGHTLHSGPAKKDGAAPLPPKTDVPANWGARSIPLHSVVIVESDTSQRRWTLQRIHSNGLVDLQALSGKQSKLVRGKYRIDELTLAPKSVLKKNHPTIEAARQSQAAAESKYRTDDRVEVRLGPNKSLGTIVSALFNPLAAECWTYTVRVDGVEQPVCNVPEFEVLRLIKPKKES